MSDSLKIVSTHGSVCIVVSAVIIIVSRLLKSSYLSDFFANNLVLLLVALLAINTTTVSVIMTKLRELTDEGKAFRGSTGDLKLSIIEQLWLIGLAVVVLVCSKSQVVSTHVPYAGFVSDVLLLAIFCYAIHILYDTANAVFVIIGFEEKKSSAK